MRRFMLVFEGTHGEDRAEEFNRIAKGVPESLRTSGYTVDFSIVDWDLSDKRHGKPTTETAAEPIADLASDDVVKSTTVFTPGQETGGREHKPAESLAAVLSVPFASSVAARLADEGDLTDTDFEEAEPSGKTGFTADDVRHIAEQKGWA